MPSFGPGPRVLLTVLPLIFGLAFLACQEPMDRFLSIPIPLSYKDGLLYGYGDARLGMDQRCVTDSAETTLTAPVSPRLLIDLATPLSVVSDASGLPPQAVPHGQVQINATKDDDSQGPPRFLQCDVKVLRGNQVPDEFRIERQDPSAGGMLVSSGPLGAVLGGDLFNRFALSFGFADAIDASGQPMTAATLLLKHSEITPSCFLDDVVLPFQPVGGTGLLVQLGDSILTYPATRVTLPACIEPLADPLVLPSGAPAITACLDATRLPPEACTEPLDEAALGDVVENQALRHPAYRPSGVNMRFLLSTAVPDLLLSETACRRLANGAERCTCAEADKVSLRLPGLNGRQADGSVSIETGCRLALGGADRAALALIAEQLQFSPRSPLSPCLELARSRRQRYALPAVAAPRGLPAESPCLREACLENLNRQSSLTMNRCAYTGMQVAQVCDDHFAPVAAFVEMGGPHDDRALPADTMQALVVPDSARILQSVNADIRNMTSSSNDLRNLIPQVDGVIGVSLLQRLYTTVDYPKQRLTVACRCGTESLSVCRSYRGVSDSDLDSCVLNGSLIVPENFGRTACR